MESLRSSLSSSPSRKKTYSDTEAVLLPEEAPNHIESNDKALNEERPEPQINVVPVKKVKAKVRVSRSPTPPQHSKRSTSPAVSTQSTATFGQRNKFAEAVANAMNEAAALNNDGDSLYFMSFSPDVDYHRSVVNLKEDRDQVLEQRRRLLQQRFDDEDLDEADGKYIEHKPIKTPNSKRKADTSSATSNVDEGDSASPQKVPYVKRRSLIKSMDMNSQLFVNGFIAKKVLIINHLFCCSTV